MEETQNNVEKIEDTTQIQEKKNNIENMFKTFSIITSIFLISLIIYLKVTLENFKSWWFILVFGFVILLLTLVFFGFNKIKSFIEKKDKDEEEIKFPKSISQEEVYNILTNCLTNNMYYNMIKKIKTCQIHHVGKLSPNLIYEFEIETLYKEKKPITTILINANFPDKISILSNPGYYDIKRAINSMSLDKEEFPEVEESSTFDSLTGRTHHYKKTSPKDKKFKIKKEGVKELE